MFRKSFQDAKSTQVFINFYPKSISIVNSIMEIYSPFRMNSMEPAYRP